MKQVPTKIYDFKSVAIVDVDDSSTKHDVSKIVGNVLYGSTPDIAAMDKAREIYHKGKTELTQEEAKYYLNLIMESHAITAPLKVALQEVLK